MIDVFYCTMPRDELREAIAHPCWLMWKSICWGEGRYTSLHWLTLPDDKMTGREFQQWRRKYAEETATTEFYILADDDCMPLGNRFLERCTELMHLCPDYAILGTEDYCAPYGDKEVYETRTAGGINVIRKGVIEVPEFNGHIWDGCAQGEQIRAKGYKVGRMRDVRRNHFGDGLSTVWPDGYASGRTQIGYLDSRGVLV